MPPDDASRRGNLVGIVASRNGPADTLDVLGQLQSLGIDIGAIADGDLDHSITVTGPPQVLAVAAAIDRTRTKILNNNRQITDSHREPASVVRERFASDLYDFAVQRLFSLGLSLQYIAACHPTLSDALQPLVNQTDAGIQELRSVIFDLHLAPANRDRP